MDIKLSTSKVVSLGRSPNRHSIAKLETRKSKIESSAISEFPPNPKLSLEDNPLSMDGLTEPPGLTRSKKMAPSIHEVNIVNKSQLSISNSQAAAEETSDEKLSAGNSPPKSNEKSITPERLDGLWKFSQDEDEDEEAVDLPPGGWGLFDGNGEEDEEATSISTPPRSTPKKGDLGITPDRTHSSISTPQKPFNRSITSGSTLQRADGSEIQFKLTPFAIGGCGTIYRVEPASEEQAQDPLLLVAKEFNDRRDPELGSKLIKKLQQVDNGSIVSPQKKIGNTIFYPEQLCDLGKLQLRPLLEKSDVETGNQFIAHMLYELIRNIGNLHDVIDAAHNDIKPANILIPTDSRTALRYGDFGSINARKSHKTGITPEFAAVEYIDREADLEFNYRVDYYSIGLTILTTCFSKNFYDLFKAPIDYGNIHEIKHHYEIWESHNEDFKALLKPDHLDFYLKYKDVLDIVMECLNPNPLKRPTHSVLLEILLQEFNLSDPTVHENIAQIFETAKQNYLSTES